MNSNHNKQNVFDRFAAGFSYNRKRGLQIYGTSINFIITLFNYFILLINQY